LAPPHGKRDPHLKISQLELQRQLAPHRAPIINVPNLPLQGPRSEGYCFKAGHRSTPSAARQLLHQRPPERQAKAGEVHSPKGAKAAKPLKGRKPYNHKSPRPEKD